MEYNYTIPMYTNNYILKQKEVFQQWRLPEPEYSVQGYASATVSNATAHKAIYLMFQNKLTFVVEKRPDLVEAGVFERIVEPERQIIFRVPWVDDNGKTQVNSEFLTPLLKNLLLF